MESERKEVRVELLGGLKLWVGASPIELPKSRKARALIAYIAAHSDPVSKQAVCEIFFHHTSDPRANLRWCLSRLRNALAPHRSDFIQSDQNNLWLNCKSEHVDVRYLKALKSNGDFGPPELALLKKAGQRQFLPEVVITRSAEFETWRSTMQVSHEQTVEEILEHAVKENEGSELALEFARLFTDCAPYSEKAWYTLITTLQESNQGYRARQFFNIAVSQLRENGIVQNGLLANAAQILSKKTRQNNLERIERTPSSAGSTATPTLVINMKNGYQLEGELQQKLFDELALAAGTNKSISYIHEPKSESYSFRLMPNFYTSEGAISIDIKFMDQATGQCLSVWETKISNTQMSEMIKQFRFWLGVKFELDVSVAMIERSKRKLQDELNEQDLYYAAFPKIYSPAGYAVHEALSLLRQSLKFNPNFGPALCSMAWVRSTHPLYNQAQKERHKTIVMARRALELSYDDPFVLSWAAVTLGHMECNPAAGLNFVNRALSLNPYSPFGYLAKGVLSHYVGDYEKSIALIESISKTGIEPISFILNTYLALNYYQMEQYETALEICNTALAQNPGYIVTLRTLIPCLIQSGRKEEAKQYAKKLIELDSSENLSYFRKYLPYAEQAPKERLIKDLELAEVPE